MLLHNDCLNCISIAQQLHICRKMKENMNWYNRHLSDITDTFRTFIGHNRCDKLGGDYYG